jgi:phosphatidylserine/phosphatidylglycerophosphate/cardiolipin synthase-like enzyme
MNAADRGLGVHALIADTNRADFMVSPVNARKQLSTLLRGARKELLIYDPEVSDPALVRLLEERAAAGVDVRMIGKLKSKSPRR